MRTFIVGLMDGMADMLDPGMLMLTERRATYYRGWEFGKRIDQYAKIAGWLVLLTLAFMVTLWIWRLL